MQHLNRFLILSLAALALAGSALQAEETSLQRLWLAAETEQNPEKAVEQWEKIESAVKRSPAEIDTGIPAEAASKMLFTAYLKANETAKAEAMIGQWQEREKIWAELLLAQKLMPTEARHAWKLIAQAAQEAQIIPHHKNRSFTLHAVLLLAMTPEVFRWDGPQLAQKLIPQILSPWHRAHAMHLLALAEPDTEIAPAKALQEALRIPLKKAKERREALLAVYESAREADRFYIALDALSGIEDANTQQKKLYDWSKELLDDRQISRAVAAAERLDYDRRGTMAWGRLAVSFARLGEETRAQEALQRCHESALLTHYEDDRKEAREADKKFTQSVKKSLESFRRTQVKKRKEAALTAAEKTDLRAAVELIKTTQDSRLRAQQFRALAEKKAQHTDAYGLLGNHYSTVKPAGNDIGDTALNTLEASITAAGNKGALDLRMPPASPLGTKIPPLPLAENLTLTAADLRAKLPLSTPFSVHRVYYGNSYFVYSKFKAALGEAHANLSEKLIAPEIIFLERGTATLPQLYDALRAQGIDDYLTQNAQAYTLRRALVVGPHASLVIDGAEIPELRQSTWHGAILVNAGNLHISDARLMSWDETMQSSPALTYEQKYDFRPFIAAWSGSHSTISGSEFLNLGYMKSKSFALTLTTGPKKRVTESLATPARPEGIIVENSFTNAYYGFYSFEADNVALIGNEYRDSVVYGIDPHDRSRALTIAFNAAYDSQQKHGIILSREVNDSSYIGNLSFDNRGSGYMLDRRSTGTYLYGNTAFGNRQDGLTLFESSCNLVASNHFFDNGSAGLRARNSQDNGIFYNRFETNKKGGVLGYSSRLEDLASQTTRDFVQDPYSNVTAMTLIGNHLTANKAGMVADNIQALTLRGNHFEKQSPRLMQGEWFRKMPYLSSQYDLAKTGVIITDTCPDAQWTPYTCRFRNAGIFDGDGQRDLAKRITGSPCRQAETRVKS